MIGLMSIKYRDNLVLNKNELEFEEDDDFVTEKDFQSKEEIQVWKEEKEENKKFSQNLSKFIKNQIASEEANVSTYIFNEQMVRLKRNSHQLEKEFLIFESQSGVLSQFYVDKEGKPKLNELAYHNLSDNSDWKVNYEINEFKDETKNILGYECYKLVIEQEGINEKKNWQNINIYEMYVTDELKLPARLVIPLWQPVTDVCALEIKTKDLKSPNSYEIQKAFEIIEDVSAKEIELPEIYKNVRY